ncbi:Uncharacterised protein [Raoultella planticola]|uniref:Uncharacterized protein n=1 Tax=Raoultella planticola TaxID=575 RepID=A0A485B349_RAOPL|nr:Uncharacterised protein [Raoultella planticola]
MVDGFSQQYFNYHEYKKVRLLLMAAAMVCIMGIWIFYPLVMRLGFSQEWLNSIRHHATCCPICLPPCRQSIDRH